MTEMTKLFNCETCELDFTSKFNLSRHCSTKKCREKHGEMIIKKEKKQTKKEIALQAAI